MEDERAQRKRKAAYLYQRITEASHAGRATDVGGAYIDRSKRKEWGGSVREASLDERVCGVHVGDGSTACQRLPEHDGPHAWLIGSPDERRWLTPQQTAQQSAQQDDCEMT
jgi:hypothetical protein